jgi:hypothetical protein
VKYDDRNILQTEGFTGRWHLPPPSREGGYWMNKQFPHEETPSYPNGYC